MQELIISVKILKKINVLFFIGLNINIGTHYIGIFLFLFFSKKLLTYYNLLSVI